MFSLKYGTSDNNIRVHIPNKLNRANTEPDLPSGPCDMWVDEYENVYITDCGNWQIKKFNNKGELIFLSKKFDGIELGHSLWGNSMSTYLVCNALFMIVGVSNNTIVKIDINNGNLLAMDRVIVNNKIYNDTHLGRIVSSCLPGFANNKYFRATPFYDQFGYEYYRYWREEELTITVKRYGDIVAEYILNASDILRSSKDSSSARILDIFVDNNGQYYIWGLVDREYPIMVDDLGYAQYDMDVIVQNIKSDGKIIDEIRFPGGCPFIGPGACLRSPIRFAPNGDFYTIEFERDNLNVVKYTWEHNKNKDENVSE
jgi:hypothetical protein